MEKFLALMDAAGMPAKGVPYYRKPKEEPARLRPKLNFVREWREVRGWTQEKLAELSGLSHSTISAYERLTATGTEPSVEALQKLGRAFGIPAGWILDINPVKNPALLAAYMRAAESQRQI